MVVGGGVKRKGFAEIRLPSGEIVHAELHWYEATGIGKREMKDQSAHLERRNTWQKRQNVYLSVSITPATRYPSSAVRFYVALPDTEAERTGYLRIIDESGEIICILPNASSPQNCLFRPVALSCTSLTLGPSDHGVAMFDEPRRGVDDWDKTASFVGAETPRRSTSSLAGIFRRLRGAKIVYTLCRCSTSGMKISAKQI